jgi:Cdc6-like AAA superfamily ATPase
VKKVYFNLVEERALNFIAQKVAHQNGDIRVAFDLMKSSLVKLQKRIKDSYILPEDELIRVDIHLVNEVCIEKYGSKIKDIVAALPRQDMMVVEAIISLVENFHEEGRINFQNLFDQTQKECKKMCYQSISSKEYIQALEEL